ncbi:MAG: class I SAM-dependent methyltransferase [Candidatus Woesearchaeota archaeon]|nr:MAG: class I SAM-dependent methyltransferase [Candidatus Woesearchaeota archaeon]
MSVETKSKFITGKIQGAGKTEVFLHDNHHVLDLSILSDGRLDLAEKLIKKFNPQGKVIEMGAGHSWMTGMMSKSKNIKEAWCIDSSSKLMKEYAPIIFKKIKAKEEKITRVWGSFYHIPCPDHYFDVVLFEASFHHVPNYELMFKELRRILKPTGMILCTRERYLRPGAFENFKKFKGHIARGVLERIFTVAEYRFIAEQHLFHYKTEPLYWYPTKNKKLRHWAKWVIEKIPVVNNKLAQRTGSVVMVMHPKAYEPFGDE